jgi:phospholipase/lecithinase/hemolysin
MVNIAVAAHRVRSPSGMRRKLSILSSFALILPLVPAVADSISPINQIVAFGDSLTDTGNASIATLGAEPGTGYAYRNIPGLPFQVGEFTNPPAPGGPSGLWIDQFAAKTGLPDPQPMLAPSSGTNFAIGSAQTGSNGSYYVSDQLGVYLAITTTVPSTTLFSVWAGSEDILNGSNPITAADNLEGNIATLAAKGGKYFLWFNLPLLGNVPAGAGNSAALNAASSAFDTEWAKDLQTLHTTYPGIVLVGVDVETLFNTLLNTPGNLGFNPGATPPGANPNNYLFSFDGLHPTSAADTVIANLALTDLETALGPTAAVPEPANVALVALGLGASLLVWRRRRKALSTTRS